MSETPTPQEIAQAKQELDDMQKNLDELREKNYYS
jgi:hypothetical protein